MENSSSHPKRAYDRGNWPRFLVVESLKAGKTLASVSPFVIARSIAGNAGTVKSVRKTRVGTLLVEVEKRQQCTNLLSMEHLGELELKVSPHRSLNSSKGVIKWRDLVGTPVEEIAEELSESGVTEVRQIGSKETGIYVLTFDMPTPPQHVKCAYIRLPVEEYIPNPMRCFKCQKYGHTMNKCNSQALCGRCGTREQDHSTRECRGKPQCVNCKGEHPAFSKKCPKFLEEKEIQSLRVKRKISFIEARKVVRATHAPSTTRSYAAAVSVKKTVGCQTPQWPEQAVKPQPKQKAPNHQAEMPKPQGKKASTTSSDRGTQSIDVGTDDEGKNTQPSIGPMPSGSSPGQSGSPSRIPVLTRGKSPPKTSGRRRTKIPPKTSGGSTKPLTPQGGEKDNQPQEERPSQPVAESSYAMKAASPPQPKPVVLKRDNPVLVNVRYRFAALSGRKNIAVLKKQPKKK